MTEAEKSFRTYKRECEVVATDFMYPQVVFDRIKAAKTEAQLSVIMTSARKEYL